MVDAWVLLPDFSLIAIGWLLCRHTPLNRPLWDGVERLVYMVLFPVLLFSSIVRYPTSLDALLNLGGVGLAIVGTGVVLAAALRAWPQRDPSLHASGQQIAYRFNSYVALALAERLAGSTGAGVDGGADLGVRAVVQRGRCVAARAARRSRLPGASWRAIR